MRKILLIAVSYYLLFSLQAQDISENLNDPIPVDDKVAIGKLDNGLTYYIRENNKPENRLELRLVVNAGSILENENQLGLAHFTEHMAFNGTKNFEKNEIVSYLQSIGVKFGADLNAYTSFDETVYMLPIPTDDPKIIEQGFQILEDWAHNLSFDPDEIDKERGVVIEEWRLGQGADRRLLDKFLPVLLKDSRYAERLPIGTLENLQNFEHEHLINFYKDWYRPELMAVVAVGDMPKDEIEARIKKYFGNIQPNPAAPERKSYGVPDHDETLISVEQDKEASFTLTRLYIKADPTPDQSLNDYRRWLMGVLYTGMLNERLGELTQQSTPPFLFASVSTGSFFARSKTAFQAFAATQEDGVKTGLKALMTELERVRRHGFTATELERYKSEIMQSYEVAYKERDKTKSENYVSEYVGNFLEEEPIPGIEFEYNFVNKYLGDISLDEINALTDRFLKEENRVLVVTGPEKEGLTYPTKDELQQVLQGATQQDIDPYDDGVVGEALMTELPEPGAITAELYHEKTDITELDLDNGVKVFLKPTEFKNDQIVMTSYSPGGHSLASDESFHSASNAASIIGLSGLGDYSNIELQKMMAGKSVSVNPFIRELSEGLQGSSTPEDMETMFQMAHMYFVAPRLDMEAFQSFIARNKGFLKNIRSNPQFYFSDQVQKILSQNHPRGGGFPTEEELDNIDAEEAYRFYQERFADASDFTFWFVGNFDVEGIKPYLTQYLGSLPNLDRNENWKDVGVRPPSGMVKETVYKGTDPKSTVIMSFSDTLDRDFENNFHFDALAELLNIRLIENLREEQSGVYGVGANANTTSMPYEHFSLQIQFPCSPDNVETLSQEALSIVQEVQTEGLSEENLLKIKEQQRRAFEVNREENNYWASQLRSYFINGWDFNKIPDTPERIANLKAEDIQHIAKTYLDTNNYIQIVLKPEEN